MTLKTSSESGDGQFSNPVMQGESLTVCYNGLNVATDAERPLVKNKRQQLHPM